MLNSIKLFLIVTAITIACAITDRLLFSEVEGGTLLVGIVFLGIWGMIISFGAVLIEIHHEATKDKGDE
jgi:hypothetical protein